MVLYIEYVLNILRRVLVCLTMVDNILEVNFVRCGIYVSS